MDAIGRLYTEKGVTHALGRVCKEKGGRKDVIGRVQREMVMHGRPRPSTQGKGVTHGS